MSEEEKDKIKEYQRQRYQRLIQSKKEALQNKQVLFLLSIRMSEKTLKFDNIRVNKQPVNLDLIKVDQIVVSDKFKHSNGGLSISLDTKKVRLLNRDALFYLKLMHT